MDRDEPNDGAMRDDRARAKLESAHDKINPKHYDGDSCMRLIAQVTARMTGKEACCIAFALKHLYRAGRKDQESLGDDCRKAKWYLGWLKASWETNREAEQMEHEGSVVKQLEDIIGYVAPEAMTQCLWGVR